MAFYGVVRRGLAKFSLKIARSLKWRLLAGVVTSSPYILDANYGAGTFSFADQAYGSEAAFLTAIGGTGAGGKAQIGPYVSPSSPELIADPTVGTGTGWAAYAIPGSPNAPTGSVVANAGDNEYQVASPAAVNRPVGAASFFTQQGKAYCGTVQIRAVGTVTTNPKAIFSNDPTSLSGLVAGSGLIAGTALSAPQVRTFAPCVGYQSMYAGVLGQNGNFVGTIAVDNASVKECRPFAGHNDGSVSGIVDFITPASLPAADQVIWQMDDGALDGATAQIRNTVALIYDTAGHVRFRIFTQTVLGSSGAQQVNIDLGAVAVATSGSVQFVATAGIAGAKLNSAAPVTATFNYMPGLAIMRFRQSQTTTTNDFAGTLQRVRLFKALTAPPGMSIAIYALAGDSYASGFGPALATATGGAVNNIGSGGYTANQILAAIQAHPELNALPMAIVDGAFNGYGTVAEYLGVWDQIIAARGGMAKTVILPCAKYNASVAANPDQVAINAGLASRAGANFVDMNAILIAAASGSGPDQAAVAGGYIPPSFIMPSPDLVHLTDAARAIVAPYIATKLMAMT